jgi:hypothetical protein
LKIVIFHSYDYVPGIPGGDVHSFSTFLPDREHISGGQVMLLLRAASSYLVIFGVCIVDDS